MQDFDKIDSESSPGRNIPTLEELIQLAPPEYIDGHPIRTKGGKIKYLTIVETVWRIAA